VEPKREFREYAAALFNFGKRLFRAANEKKIPRKKRSSEIIFV